jgi:hypothetical protein
MIFCLILPCGSNIFLWPLINIKKNRNGDILNDIFFKVNIKQLI